MAQNAQNPSGGAAPVLPSLTPPPAIAPTQSALVSQASGSTLSRSSGSSSSSQSTSGSNTTHSGFTIPITAPIGQFIVTQPSLAAQAGVTSLFKIWPTGNPVNASANQIIFGWNITGVYDQVHPTSVTVRAACQNGFTYPVGGGGGAAAPSPTGDGDDGNVGDSNSDQGNSTSSGEQDGVVPASVSAVTWDPVQYVSGHPDIPVPEGICTLQIAGDRGFKAAPRPGYLSPNTDAAVFALYTGEAYTPLASGFTCQGCKPNSISSAYNANPIALSLLVSLVVSFLSGVGLLVRGSKRPSSRIQDRPAVRRERSAPRVNGSATGVYLGGAEMEILEVEALLDE